MFDNDEGKITDFAWYRTRADALLQGIHDLDTAIVELEESLPSHRLNIITHLLTRLEAFGRSHFKFFYEGFANGDLEISSEFPPQRVFESILDQISFDLEVILRASSQRRQGIATMNDTLVQADKLAMLALDYAVITASLVDSPVPEEPWTALTYLQKSPSVRVIPYANVALVGVPLTSLMEKRDLLAIPHEVGHFVYWRRVRSTSPVSRALFLSPPSIAAYRKWEEEMFADAYGAITAGPILALDFQELALEHIPDQFLDENDDHPSPILRPLLYAKVIEARGEKVEATLLRERWMRIMALRMDQLTEQRSLDLKQFQLWMQARNQVTKMQLGEGNGLDEALKIIWDNLKRGSVGNWTGANLVTKLQNEVSDAAAAALTIPPTKPDLYDEYRNHIQGLTDSASTLSWENPPMAEDNIWEVALGFEGLFDGKSCSNWLAEQKAAHGHVKAGALSDLDQLPNNTWIQIWLATGWTSDGSGPDPKGPLMSKKSGTS
jgi:hypothetical protein